MRPASLIAALAGWLLSTAAFAADPSFCHSVCDSELRACKADAQQLAMEDREDLISTPDKNPIARTAARTGAPSPVAAQAVERTALSKRRAGRLAACDTSFKRCERSCKAPEAKAPASPIYTPRKSG